MSDRITSLAEDSKKALPALSGLNSGEKKKLLASIADLLIRKSDWILEENQKDIDNNPGLTPALKDRLRLTPERIKAMAEGVIVVSELENPAGRVLSEWTTEDGLHIQKCSVPIGLIGIIYEARPNVTVDAAALCLYAGNGVLLRGSSSAYNSNLALVNIIKQALKSAGLPEACVSLLPSDDRNEIKQLLTMRGIVDLIIPRGGKDLIDYVVENATVPVIETGAGVCHIFIDDSADPAMALAIAINAKAQRPSVCNACETILLTRNWSENNLPSFIAGLKNAGIAIRGCEQTRKCVSEIEAANESDWETEYLDLIVSVKIVEDVREGVSHISKYGTRHSEAIISEDLKAVKFFFERVDAAAVYHNASTRFTDGFKFGFGAEIGISTQKLHARGPVGLPELTTYKYQISGNGSIRAS